MVKCSKFLPPNAFVVLLSLWIQKIPPSKVSLVESSPSADSVPSCQPSGPPPVSRRAPEVPDVSGASSPEASEASPPVASGDTVPPSPSVGVGTHATPVCPSRFTGRTDGGKKDPLPGGRRRVAVKQTAASTGHPSAHSGTKGSPAAGRAPVNKKAVSLGRSVVKS